MIQVSSSNQVLTWSTLTNKAIYSIFIKLLLPAILMLSFLQSNSQNLPSGFSQVRVASGILDPGVIAFAPDGRILVGEQGGKVRIIKNGQVLPTPFLQLQVNVSGERGIIGLALDPDFSRNGFVYVHYTLPDASYNRVSRFTASGDVAQVSTEKVILNLDPLS